MNRNTLRKYIVVAVALLASALSQASAYTLWTNVTGQAGRWQDTLALPGGGFVVCGYIYDGNNAGTHSAVVRCWNPDGTIRWTYEFPDPQGFTDESMDQLALAPDGSIVAAGGRDSFNTLLLVRLSVDGVEQDRAHRPLGQSYTHVTDLAIGPSGWVYVSLFDAATYTGVLKGLDSNFQSVWARTDEYISRIEVLPNGNLAAGGGGQLSGWFTLYDLATGITIGQTALMNRAKGLAVTPEGDCYVTEWSGDLHRFDRRGRLVWTRRQNRSWYNPLPCIVRGERGERNIVVAGTYPYYVPGSLNAACYDSAGNLLWQHDGVATESTLWDVVSDRFGNTVFATTTLRDAGSSNMKSQCVALDAKGRPQWTNDLTQFADGNEFFLYAAMDDRLRLCVSGNLDDAASSGSFGFGWRMSQFFFAPPDSDTVRQGRLDQGTVASLAWDDGDEYVLSQAIRANNQPPIVADFDTAFPINDVNPGTTTLSLYFRARRDANFTVMRVQVYDWRAKTWETQIEQLMLDYEYSYELNLTNIGRFFQPGTTNVRVRFAALRVGGNVGSRYRIALDRLYLRSDTQ